MSQIKVGINGYGVIGVTADFFQPTQSQSAD